MILSLESISLSFGGVKALTDISFDVREHEIRAIIGPNGAGKSSMLNVINGVYHPQQGRIVSTATERKNIRPHRAAREGIARTFQNIALFKGMSGAGQHHDRPQHADARQLRVRRAAPRAVAHGRSSSTAAASRR